MMPWLLQDLQGSQVKSTVFLIPQLFTNNNTLVQQKYFFTIMTFFALNFMLISLFFIRMAKYCWCILLICLYSLSVFFVHA